MIKKSLMILVIVLGSITFSYSIDKKNDNDKVVITYIANEGFLIS